MGNALMCLRLHTFGISFPFRCWTMTYIMFFRSCQLPQVQWVLSSCMALSEGIVLCVHAILPVRSSD